jgi:hypothetical protein
MTSSQIAVRGIKAPMIKRAASAAVKAALTERHTLIAVGAAGALGVAERMQVPLPHLSFLGKAGTYGVAAWIAGKATGNPTAQHVATGLLSVALYELTSGRTKAAASGAGPAQIVGESMEGEVIVGEI